MNTFDFINMVWLPLGLGLFGFIEPCSIGASLLFAKYLEGKETSHKLMQVSVFALVRALFMGALGLAAFWIGTSFLRFQQGVWIVFGAIYVLIGSFYVTGTSRILAVSLGVRLSKLSGLRGSVGLGLLFAFNIPACAGPLIFALLASAAARGATGGALASSFVSLSIFGAALSLPLVLLVLFPSLRRGLDLVVGLSGRLPFWTGLVFIFLGLWSVAFGFFPVPGKLGPG